MLPLPRVLYWSHAPESVYAVLREAAQGKADLRTLPSDDQAARRRALAQAQVLIVAARGLPAQELAFAPHLRLVHHQGVGYQDTVPVADLQARGIRLALTPEGTTTGVAEHTVMLLLAACKRLAHVDAELRQGRWHVNTYRSVCRELCGMTVGLVGFGRIGQAVAARLQGFGAHVVYSDPGISAPVMTLGAGAAHAMPLQNLLASADAVTLHLPSTPATRHLIDAAALARMKRGAFLINASRGGLVDEAALAQALLSGHLAGAGLDCFEQEPPPPDHPLLALPNVVLTPHTAAATIDALRTKMAALFANVARWHRDGELQNEVQLGAHG